VDVDRRKKEPERGSQREVERHGLHGSRPRFEFENSETVVPVLWQLIPNGLGQTKAVVESFEVAQGWHE
jgi:hypothetical protein